MLKNHRSHNLLIFVQMSVLLLSAKLIYGAEIDSSTFTQIRPTIIQLNDNGLVGELYLPTEGDIFPAIIAISGSDGSISTARAIGMPFAFHGYAVLVLSYWNADGLPSSIEEVPLEYFDGAISWLQDQPRVDRARIGILGWSRGAEAALLVASRNKAIRTVVALSPPHTVWPAYKSPTELSAKSPWTRNGRPVGHLPNEFTRNLELDGIPSQYRDTSIPVEEISGPVLLLTGDDDRIWPSKFMAEQLISRLQSSNFPYDFAHISYPEAGHAVFVGATEDPGGFSSLQFIFGGTTEGNARAWQDSWPKVLSFFDTHLVGSQ